MNKTEALAKALNDALTQSDIHQQYLQSLKNLQAHPEILEMEQQLKTMQMALVQAKTDEDNADFNALSKQYATLKAEFESHPIICNYLNDKEELNRFLQHVKVALQGALDEEK